MLFTLAPDDDEGFCNPVFRHVARNTFRGLADQNLGNTLDRLTDRFNASEDPAGLAHAILSEAERVGNALEAGTIKNRSVSGTIKNRSVYNKLTQDDVNAVCQLARQYLPS